MAELWRGSTTRAEKKRVQVWHTLGLVSAVLPASVQPRQACPRSRSEGKGVSYRYGARGGPGAFAERLGRAFHPAAKTLAMWYERLSEIVDLSLSDAKRRKDYIASVFAAERPQFPAAKA